jgi:hypothetical protein
MAEFWVHALHPESMYYVDVRGAASAAHAYGKPIVATESFTGGGYESPYTLKKIADYWFAQGVNRLVFHTSAQQPLDTKPGNTMVGTHINRNITWAEQARPFMTYVARTSYMLQQGRPVADIAYLLPEGAPSTMPFWGSGQFVAAGATIAGPRPASSPSLLHYPDADTEVHSLATDLWGDIDGVTLNQHGFGKGITYSGLSIEEILNRLKVSPDFASGNSLDNPPVWIHRHTPDAEIYFVANQSDVQQSIEARFRVAGKDVQIWRPMDGTMTGNKPASLLFRCILPNANRYLSCFATSRLVPSVLLIPSRRQPLRLSMAPGQLIFRPIGARPQASPAKADLMDGQHQSRRKVFLWYSHVHQNDSGICDMVSPRPAYLA